MPKIKIIAEIGVNHDGSLKKAKKLIDIAKKAGADYVKIQIYITSRLVVSNTSLAKYQKDKVGDKYNDMSTMLKKYELSHQNILKLKEYSKLKKIGFMASVFDEKSLDFYFNHINKRIIKIPSGEITNIPLLKKISKLYKKIILSTGASKLQDIKFAYKTLKNTNNEVIVLHCNSSYPTNYDQIYLKNIVELKKILKCKVGISDHTIDSEIAIASCVLGIVVIEKHITVNKSSKGPDHSSSMEPKEFMDMITKIKNVEKSLMLNRQFISSSEIHNQRFMRKSIYANKEIKIGEKFSFDNLTCKRPAIGMQPVEIYDLIGKKSKKNFKRNELILLKYI